MIAELSMVPVGKGESLSGFVANILAIVEKSGRDYRLTAMGTLVEGNADKVRALLERRPQASRQESRRVLTFIRIDDRRGAKKRLVGKVRAVEKKMGRKVSSAA